MNHSGRLYGVPYFPFVLGDVGATGGAGLTTPPPLFLGGSLTVFGSGWGVGAIGPDFLGMLVLGLV
jgi:hypothetical protein